MLINLSVKNLISFKDQNNLSMLSSSAKNTEHNNCFESDLGGDTLLKSALIFGANASGKSNFIKSAYIVRDLIISSLANVEEAMARQFVPFLFNINNLKEPSEVELLFYSDSIKYRYGVAVSNGKIKEEWLYYTPESRETMLFHRENQTVEFNKQGFSEGSKFIKSNTIQQTREDVPFISVIASFNGEHSTRVLNWFKKLHVISGINDSGFKEFTSNLLEKDQEFKTWLLKILKNFQIHGITLKETHQPSQFDRIKFSEKTSNKITNALKNLNQTNKTTEIFVKKKINDVEVELPISMESEGTKKLMYMLGPIYDSMKLGNVLLVDEFDSKFHTLLTKFIFSIFHSESKLKSQLIAAVQDVNLMDPSSFRRDQIWFVDKDSDGGSSIYSLVEYKEKTRAIRRNFGEEYLKGAYGAIPLFDSCEDIETLMETKDGE